MDLAWWIEHIPGYDTPHRDLRETFGTDTHEAYRVQLPEISALSLISADDPPIFMTYGMHPDDPPPTEQRRVEGWKVHHVNFGIALQERLEELGVESHLKYPRAAPQYQNEAEFFISKLTATP